MFVEMIYTYNYNIKGEDKETYTILVFLHFT